MASDPLKWLKECKTKLDAAEANKQRLSGRKDALMDRLRTEFGLTTVKDAERKADELDAEATDLERQFKDKKVEVDELLAGMENC